MKLQRVELVDESQVRAALFVWLEKESGRNGGIFTRKELETGFSVGGETIALVGPTGIVFIIDILA